VSSVRYRPSTVTEITDDEFTLFQTLICREAGLHLGPTKKAMLVSRLLRRLSALQLESFGDYYRHVIRQGEGELVRMLDAISTNETWFFRNPKHFSYVKETLCPRWISDAEAGRRPRQVAVWSAACSSGEEPFSLAMVLRDALPGWSIQIVASDLSTRILEQARGATWPIEKSKDIPAPYLKRFMLRGRGEQGGKMRAGADLRSLVSFQRLNLNDDVWRLDPAGPFDVVFCRNVLMYFESSRRERVVGRILERLSPSGCLFLGDAEALSGFPALKMVAPSIHAFRRDADAALPGQEPGAAKEAG
jgi:chemotaxis protein methyltransferase CheR